MWLTPQKTKTPARLHKVSVPSIQNLYWYEMYRTIQVRYEAGENGVWQRKDQRAAESLYNPAWQGRLPQLPAVPLPTRDHDFHAAARQQLANLRFTVL